MKPVDWHNKNTIRIISVGILVCLFFVGIVFGYYNMVYEEKRSNIIKDGRMAAIRSADQFDRYLSTNVDLIKFAAYTLDEMITENRSDQEIQDYLVAQSTAVKNAVLENSTGLYGYINGRFFSGTNWVPPDGYDATIRPWYTKPMKNPGQLTILEPYLDVQSGNTMLALGKTLCDGDSVISVDVSLDQMQKLTEEAVTDGGSDIEIILTGDGTVVTHSDKSEVGKWYGEKNGSLGSEVFTLLGTAQDNYFEFDHDWKHYIVYDAMFEGDWHCVSIHDATSVFASLRQIFVGTVFVVVVIVLITLILISLSNKRAVMASRAVAANEARNDFLSKMSHEIRTPINAVLGMNEMILRECTDRNILGYSEKIRMAGQELLRLINELLDFSKSEPEKAETGAGSKDFVAPSAAVLVVDDSPLNLEVMRSLLKNTQITVVSALGGEEALELTETRKFDLIFLDQMMPGLDGTVTLKELRKRKDNPNIETPAICITANVVRGARDKYISEGFCEYMTKPVAPEMLGEMLMKYLPEEKIKQRPDTEESLPKSGLSEEADKEKLALLRDFGGINIEEGIKNSGSVQAYIPILRIFYSSIEERAEEIDGYLREGDIRNYTIKVHAVKSSARIIGASDFGRMAQALENAGKSNDLKYISSHHESFMSEYKSFARPLSMIFDDKEDSDRPEADEELMKDVYEELRQAADDMDCDALQSVFKEMEGYRIPEESAGLWKKLKEASGSYDYDLVLQLLEEAGLQGKD